MAERKSREEKMSEIQEKLEKGVRDIFESDKYREYISTMSKFPNYSINNCILIASQKPEASYVCGFNKWKELGRAVNKGSHGIMIIAPVKVKKDMEEPIYDENRRPVVDASGKCLTEKVTKEFQTFRPVYVFDYMDTTGDPLPTLATMLDEKVDSFEQLKEILIRVSPVPVTFEAITGRANGYFVPGEQRIVVKENLPELQMVKTMIHAL